MDYLIEILAVRISYAYRSNYGVSIPSGGSMDNEMDAPTLRHQKCQNVNVKLDRRSVQMKVSTKTFFSFMALITTATLS